MKRKWRLGAWIIAALALLLNASSIYEYEVKTSTHTTTTLESYRGKVLLIVNTASQCGYTPQLGGLENLYRTYRPQGFAVLGFPSNQFAGQEPLRGEAIVRFCREKYDVTFPIFDIIDVNGENAHPLYRYLKTAAGGLSKSEPIPWNFTKFLVDRNGNVIRRYAPSVKPEAIAGDIEALLKK